MHSGVVVGVGGGRRRLMPRSVVPKDLVHRTRHWSRRRLRGASDTVSSKEFRRIGEVARMEAQLSVGEAGEIAHALVSSLARDLGVRALSIKGPVADHYQLRSPRVAADADILVEPSRFSELCESLQQRGWHKRVGRATPVLLPQHSVTYIHSDWPCDIDVHWMFPGFFRSVDSAFDALWIGRSSLQLAGQEVAIPSRAGAAVVAGLHARRSSRSNRHQREQDGVDEIVLREFTTAQQREFLRIAEAGGALWTLRDLVLRLDYVGSLSDATAHEQRMWDLNRTYLEDGSAVGWWVQIRAVPWCERASLLARALWVPRKDIPRNSSDAVPRWRDALAYQINRWRRGTRAIIRYARGPKGEYRR
ncbi:nucleotidyltransferase family protein [Microbacterium sp. GCM10011525]|uniref:nucleotidyltransferase family protein n=1 Tax=unclassified Microbacterium TaxID=2609290 RepID=UPI00137C7873|nr:hypothetical protein [Microbacterium sp. MAH-37]